LAPNTRWLQKLIAVTFVGEARGEFHPMKINPPSGLRRHFPGFIPHPAFSSYAQPSVLSIGCVHNRQVAIIYIIDTASRLSELAGSQG
jgi:hypothetical protein